MPGQRVTARILRSQSFARCVAPIRLSREGPDCGNSVAVAYRDSPGESVHYREAPPADSTSGAIVDDDADFERILAGLKAGDPATVEEVFHRYGPFLLAVVRRQLHPKMRSRLDSMDIVQDVWASFLTIPAEQLNFNTQNALVAFLGQVAYRRTIELFRKRFETGKDDITREQAAEAMARGRDHLPDRGPTPSLCVSAGEEWEKLLDRFPEGQRVILRRLREGHDHREIAQMANVSVSTVNRVVRRLKDMTGA